MQLSIVEFARDVVGFRDAHSIELNPATTHPVITAYDQPGLIIYGQCIRYTLGKEEGLFKAILNVVEDKNHDIWISTVTSIYKIKVDRRADKYSFHVISCLSKSIYHGSYLPLRSR